MTADNGPKTRYNLCMAYQGSFQEWKGAYHHVREKTGDTHTLPPYDTIRAFALKISMATFLKGNIVNNDSDEKIKLDSDEIEKGILKQLFYTIGKFDFCRTLDKKSPHKGGHGKQTID